MKKHMFFWCASAILLIALDGCQQSSTARLEANKDIVRRFAEALNNQEFDALDDLVAPDFVRHSQASGELQAKSRDEFKQLQKEFLKSFPDQRVTTELLIAEGDYVAAYATYSGTQEGPMPPFPASGKKAESKFLSIFRFKEGKIAELWVEWDNLAMLQQLGHFPPPTMIEK
ncbi:MAG: ester cyclase [bacterium]